MPEHAPGGRTPEDPEFFESPEAFRAWLEENHGSASELWVGYHKVATGRPSLTWAQSVDQALCFGWIDGVRKSLGPQAYTIRFTPRNARSVWSAVNIDRMRELHAAGLVSPAGLRAFEAREEERSRVYSYERAAAALSPEQEAALRANPAAWAFWEAQPAGYRRVAAHWVASAKREETRLRRLETLVADCAARRRIGALIPPGGPRRPDARAGETDP